MRPALVVATSVIVAASSFLLTRPALAADPATDAATPPAASESSPRATTDEPTLNLISYDAATRVARVTITHAFPGESFRLYHADGNRKRTFVSYQAGAHHVGDPFATRITDVYRGDVIRLPGSVTNPASTVRIPTGPKAPAAHVETRAHDGLVEVTYTHPRAGGAVVFNSRGDVVHRSTTTSQDASGMFVSRFTMADPGRAQRLTVTSRAISEVDDVVFTLGHGEAATKPEAPTVESVSTSGSTTVAKLRGETGGLVVVHDNAGKTVAIKLMPSAGVAQIAVPRAPGAAAPVFTVTQEVGGEVSDPATFSA